MNNDLLNKLMHDLRSKLRDMFILLDCLNESTYIGGLLFGSINVGGQLCYGRPEFFCSSSYPTDIIAKRSSEIFPDTLSS